MKKYIRVGNITINTDAIVKIVEGTDTIAVELSSGEKIMAENRIADQKEKYAAIVALRKQLEDL